MSNMTLLFEWMSVLYKGLLLLLLLLLLYIIYGLQTCMLLHS